MWGTPRFCDTLRSTPLGNLDPVIRLFEGNFLDSLREAAQESRISRRLPWPRTQSAPLASGESDQDLGRSGAHEAYWWKLCRLDRSWTMHLHRRKEGLESRRRVRLRSALPHPRRPLLR